MKTLREQLADTQFNSLLETREVLTLEQRRKFAEQMQQRRKGKGAGGQRGGGAGRGAEEQGVEGQGGCSRCRTHLLRPCLG